MKCDDLRPGVPAISPVPFPRRGGEKKVQGLRGGSKKILRKVEGDVVLLREMPKGTLENAQELVCNIGK